ncbi:glycine betaine ABC transporter substrate-binding protein [Desulfohalovibrio reitneri]|uniref:glycine betaine ABC transporter substrate-binding protein n=1 Tax=Desulfohalovibrio reitneri TaxID=1307759 RepID=UPI0004A6C613|nr:glycine betaine ABC transporter substrate-binding protein [Desulfohalovibrio reitneri]
MKKLLMFAAALVLAFSAIPAHAAKGTVELAYVEWASEVASTNVVKYVMEEKMDYEVVITPVSVGPMYAAVAAGDVDGMVASWQPLQEANLKAVEKDLVNLGPNMTGVQSGLVVPQYVTIDSIGEMKDHADKFGERIVGIDPGAGVMQKTEQAIDEYGLDNIDLIDASGAMMTASLKDAIRNNEWIAVTGWTPHWKWAVWDLKYLKDPKGVYKEGTILTLVRKGLKDDMPEIYTFLDNFNWTPDQMASVMSWVRDGMEPAAAAKKYVDEHPEQVQSWLP